jgi:predicted lipid-binding transport protein (Tim44 family)
MQVDLDILVYAVIAALLLGRLWAVLGTRNDDDPQRPNPFTPQPPKPPPPQTADDPFALPPPTASRMPAAALPPASLAGGLAQVKAADPLFDEKPFLQKARDAFTAVVAAYAEGNLTSVATFLSPALLAHFQQAADARISEGQTAQSRIARIKETEAVAARAEGKQVFVTVRFVTDQENILRDRSGAVIGGVIGKTEEVVDVWVFTRDAQTPDAPWVVVETRG